MKRLSMIQTAACAGLLFAAIAPRAVRADEWDKKTYITFSDTVQMPGATLPAGKYVFKLVESNANRYVVQVFNERENHVFTTVIAIPNYRMKTPDKTIITFYESPEGQPQPVRAWFYPGDNFGREFVYPKSEAALIAKGTKETVRTEEVVTVAENTSTATQETAVAAAEPEPVKTAEPEPTPVVAEPAPPAPVAEPAATVVEQPATDGVAPATDDTPASMPSTGSELPMVVLVGLTSIATAMAMRTARRAS
jgi:hypothetical protein